MRLKNVILGLTGTGLACASVAAAAPMAAITAGAVAIGVLSGILVWNTDPFGSKHFDQDNLKEADKTVEAYHEHKRQAATEPTVGVIIGRPFWDAPLEQVPASQFCKLYRIYKDINTWSEIDVRYHSGTGCGGRGYYCLADGSYNFLNSDVFGSAQAPTTARQPAGFGHEQTFAQFSAECNAVVAFCGNR